MAPTQREREAARKRQAKWEAQQAAARERRRRIAAIVAAVVVLALVGTGIVAALLGDSPAPEPTPAATAPTATPTPTPTPTAPVPDPALAEGRTWTSTIRTSAGDITLELDGAAAPQAVASFVTLAQQGFFDGTPCHRLVTAGIFVLQCGDPTGTGTGGPGYTFGPIENAPADDFYPAGTLAMARRGGDGASMGSQFFLVYQDSTIPSDAAGGYTVFGRITQGLDVVQAVADAGVAGGASDGAPATPVTIEGVETQ
ncbi:peptidylprolyl isomerase [Xylanimonas protaetiae]|uniref:Peptidylprolyl isomerase n=1 Tax=Xylanimonas protaetiae TaxID=2509457 RepID=A0A4P6F590_9MICO|nr:peptidylprolyl isomerase [Xylanimonas protaetiae]QAY71120.1 peptidylprolyl isomerase [Xylanimonas protaetiae]